MFASLIAIVSIPASSFDTVVSTMSGTSGSPAPSPTESGYDDLVGGAARKGEYERGERGKKQYRAKGAHPQ